MKEKQESIFLQKWKKVMMDTLILKYQGEGKTVSKKKLNQFLDDMIDRHMQEFKVILENNYRKKKVNTDFLSLIDHIEKRELILGGGATVFLNHDQKDNPMIYYLIDNMAERSAIKKHNKTLPEGSFELMMGDIKQGNVKLKNNTFYGALGNKYFRFHNIYVAEAVTMLGRNIISTAAVGFEGFLGDNVEFNEESEVFQYIININNEYQEKHSHIDICGIPGLPVITNEMVCNRILDKCKFDMSDSCVSNITDVILGLSAEVKCLLYFKNNLYEFLKIPVITDKLAYVIQNMGVLMAPEYGKIPNEECVPLVKELWELLNVYVYYSHPIYDRIRKTKYTSKKAVFYIDTDSNFIALNPFVTFALDEVLQGKLHGMTRRDFEYTTCNLITIFLNHVVEENLFTMARKMRVPEEFVPKLNMKNEFYFRRIIFTLSKKRYIALKVIQEGRLLNGGEGKEELKGFDFKKSVTKETIRNYYTNLCLDEILRADEINPRNIFRKIKEFEGEMRQSLVNMEPTYYKQAAVQTADHYKVPYSNSGYKALMLWNTLCPNYAMKPPANVDIIPIKEMNKPKVLMMLREKYPETYELLNRKILCNPNPNIAGMKLNYIAVPRGMTYEIPGWLVEILDIDSIIDANINMIISITNSVGLKALVKGKSGRPHISNIIDL